MRIIRALFLTLFIFGLLGWVYIAMNAVFHPETLSMPLTHLFKYPREDTFGIVCFATSMFSFFVWNVLKNK